jgi:hypothetical protein
LNQRIVAATKEVTALHGIIFCTSGAKSKIKFNLVIIKIPAVTIAACINADTGVSSHRIKPVYNGICADLPQAPMNKKKAAIEIN